MFWALDLDDFSQNYPLISYAVEYLAGDQTPLPTPAPPTTPSPTPQATATPAPTPVLPTTLPTSKPTTPPPSQAPSSAPTTGITPAPTPKPSLCTVVPMDGVPASSQPSEEQCSRACSFIPSGVWPCKSEGPCKCDTTEAPTAMPTPYPSPVPTPMPTPMPTPYPSPRQPTSMPTSVPPATPLPTATPLTSNCVDYAGKVCHACLANNNVCYTEPQEWCDMYPEFRWCGASRRLLSVTLGDTVML